MDETTSTESKTNRAPSTPKRDILYAEAAKYAKRAIEVLAELMEDKDNANARMGAAKTILAKAIPDLKAIELSGQNGQPIQFFINAGSGFIPANLGFNATSTPGDTAGSTQIQSTSVAQTSTQDDNGNNRSS